MTSSNNIRCAIVDDEQLARKVIRTYLKEYSDVEIVGEASNCDQAILLIERECPDLLFLDIQMPGKDGFQVLKALHGTRLPTVVFVTAYDQYALNAFRVHAVDYLLKPFDRERFDHAMQHAMNYIRLGNVQNIGDKLLTLLASHNTSRSGLSAAAPEPKQSKLVQFVVRFADRMFFVKAGEVEWIGVEDNYAVLHAGMKTHLLRETLRELERKLDPQHFARIHRSIIVNLDHLKEFQLFSSSESLVIMKSGAKLKVSRRYLKKLKTSLGHE